jgi:excisionase family DNA binding protein
MKGGEKMNKYYSIKEVASALSLAEVTIRKWIASGKIKATKLGKAVRISEEEIIKLQKGNN